MIFILLFEVHIILPVIAKDNFSENYRQTDKVNFQGVLALTKLYLARLLMRSLVGPENLPMLDHFGQAVFQCELNVNIDYI